MNNIILLPQAQRTNHIEDAVILDEFKAENHFIEANTQEVTFEHLKKDCITPVFAKDNELTINHADFIETIEDATRTFFHGQKVETPNIRVSHVIKGRIPEALHKPANQLLDSDKTIYYERAAFCIDIPTVFETVMGNKLNLSIVGVRAYNQMNLYSKKSPELFRLAIGFKNQVCCNMCIFTDGYKESDIYQWTLSCSLGAIQLFQSC